MTQAKTAIAKVLGALFYAKKKEIVPVIAKTAKFSVPTNPPVVVAAKNVPSIVSKGQVHVSAQERTVK